MFTGLTPCEGVTKDFNAFDECDVILVRQSFSRLNNSWHSINCQMIGFSDDNEPARCSNCLSSHINLKNEIKNLTKLRIKRDESAANSLWPNQDRIIVQVFRLAQPATDGNPLALEKLNSLATYICSCEINLQPIPFTTSNQELKVLFFCKYAKEVDVFGSIKSEFSLKELALKTNSYFVRNKVKHAQCNLYQINNAHCDQLKFCDVCRDMISTMRHKVAEAAFRTANPHLDSLEVFSELSEMEKLRLLRKLTNDISNAE